MKLFVDVDGKQIMVTKEAVEKPDVIVGSQVALSRLEALPWATDGRHGVDFHAVGIKPAGASAGK
ncbi:hypothetical protein AB0J35_03810 [Nonomuraea angiospora]|uniref:hypothetical protein n=1 Tax=Nonomuraea angiospora TaxID=46172 RepID=UPI0034354B5D